MFALWLWVRPSFAVAVPDLTPRERVYVVPDSYAFPTEHTRAAAAAATHRILVVTFEKVDDGDHGSWESYTEDALETVLAGWRNDADYRADTDSLVVLSMDEREVRLVAGSKWDHELGLHDDALLPMIDSAFLPIAKTGDMDGALAALVGAFDREIALRIDRKARTAVPGFDARRLVYTVPEGWTATSATESALREGEPTTFVVAFQKVDDGDRGRAPTFTEDALDSVLEAWSRETSFDPATMSVAVVGWDAKDAAIAVDRTSVGQLLLSRDATHDLALQAFRPEAVAGDPDAAMAALVFALHADRADRTLRKDAMTIPRFDPALHVVASPSGWTTTKRTEAAVAAAGRPTYVVLYEKVHDLEATGSVTFTEDALEDTRRAWLAEGLPPDAALIVYGDDERRWQGKFPTIADGAPGIRERGGAENAGNADASAAVAVKAISDEGVAAEEAEAARLLAKAEALERARREKAVVVAALGVAAVLAGLAFSIVRARGARRRFELEATELEERLARAEDNFQTFRADATVPDRIVELKMRGPVTLGTVERVLALIDEIEVGVKALRAHVARTRTAAEGRPRFSASAWEEALALLEAPFTVDTAQVQHRLFEGPTRQVRIAPTPFLQELDQKYAEAHAGWARLLDAVAASLRTASMDFPADDLLRMRAELAAAELPEAWVASHPLLHDPDAEWARLDEIRRADPVAYLDALDAAIAHDDALEHDVSRVVSAVRAAREAREAALAVSIDDLATDSSGSVRDPVPAFADATLASAALDEEVAAAARVDELVARAETAETAWLEVRSRREATRAAVSGVDHAVADATTAVSALKVRVETAMRRLTEALAEHTAESLRDGWAEVTAAHEDLEQAERALEMAREARAQGKHLLADDGVRAAQLEHAESVRNLEDTSEVMEALAAARAEAQADLSAMSRTRQRREMELSQLGGYGSTEGLREGDALLESVRARTRGAADWRAVAHEIAAVHEAWTRHVAACRSRYEQHLREEEERRRRAAAAAAARARSHSYASSSSSRSRSSFSSGGGSAGRSFSSGGRSAGRKF